MMKRIKMNALAPALLAAFLHAGAAGAAEPERGPFTTPTTNAGMSAAQRGQAAKSFVLRWGPYVEQTYGLDMGVWARRLGPTFGNADPSNILASLKRTTFEGATATLNGVGHRLSDAQAIDRLARLPATGYEKKGEAVNTLLGALSNDLVYTPVQPCRILDTRNVGAGAIAANTTRSFVAFGVSSYTSQGGSATNCGMGSVTNATAVAINLTAVMPSIAGWATAYPYGTTQPLAASVNYAAGAIVNNSLIVQTPNPFSSYDFTLYSVATSHYVADIVGYFAPPVATPLECTTVTGTATTVPANNFATATVGACPATHTQVSLNCDTNNYTNIVSGQRASSRQCFFNNQAATASTGTASVNCCRVPGR